MNIERDVLFSDLPYAVSGWEKLIPPDQFGLLKKRLNIIKSHITEEVHQLKESHDRYPMGEFILKTLTVSEICGFNAWWKEKHSDETELSGYQDTLFLACNVYLKDDFRKLISLEKKLQAMMSRQGEILCKMHRITEKYKDSELNEHLNYIKQQFDELSKKIQFGYDSDENICSHRDILDESGILLIGVKRLKEKVKDFLQQDVFADEISNVLNETDAFLMTYIENASFSDDGPTDDEVLPEIQSPKKSSVPVSYKSIKENLSFSGDKGLRKNVDLQYVPEKKIPPVKIAVNRKNLNKDPEIDIKDKKQNDISIRKIQKINPSKFYGEDESEIKEQVSPPDNWGVNRFSPKKSVPAPDIVLPPELSEPLENHRLNEEMTMEEKLKILDDLTVDDVITDESDHGKQPEMSEQSGDSDVFLDLGSIEGLPAELGLEEIKKILEFLGESVGDPGASESLETGTTENRNEKTKESLSRDEKEQKQKMEALGKLSSFLNEKLTETQRDSLNASLLEAKKSKRDYTSVIEHILSEMPATESGVSSDRVSEKSGVSKIKKNLSMKPAKTDNSFIVKGEEPANKIKIRRILVHLVIYLVIFVIFSLIMSIGVVANRRAWLRNYFAGGKSTTGSTAGQSEDVENEIISPETHYQIDVIGKIRLNRELSPVADSEGIYTLPGILIICYIPELQRQYEFAGKTIKFSETGDFKVTINIPKSDAEKCPEKIQLTLLHERFKDYKSKSLDVVKNTSAAYVPDIYPERKKSNL